jgi:DNA-binding NarL/FixJ family response regulator
VTIALVSAVAMSSGVSGPALHGRRDECQTLDRLVARARAGESQVLVMCGDAGIGKTALLEYVSARAPGCRVARAAGVESEMELPFAGLHQLCAPVLDRLDRLPGPQRDALATVFGLSDGPPPDRFLIGLSVLSLLADGAEHQPLVCLIDDAQWLDHASAQTLAFVARRMLAEPVALIFATRPSSDDRFLRELPELAIRGLTTTDARTLLLAALHGPVDAAVTDRIVAESHGNPLALLELPRTWSAAELAGGFGMPGTVPLADRIEQSYLRRLRSLPSETQRVLLAAAAEPVGDLAVLRRALGLLGVPIGAADPAEAAGLIEFGAQVRFSHPLVRSAVYRAASPEQRRGVHRCLAEATEPRLDPDRRAWHLAHATPGPDEEVAAELERCAGRAQARGGLAAAAAFLERSASLTVDPARRVRRMLVAAQFDVQAGAFDAALALLAAARAGRLDAFGHARVDLLRGQVASASDAGSAAPALLLNAARRLESLDLALARETYVDAWGAALFAGRLAGSGNLLEVSRAARAAPRPAHQPRSSDLLLDGLAELITDGRAAAAPTLRRAVSAFHGEDASAEKGLQWAVMASCAAVTLWDFDSWDTVISRQVDLARGAGALAQLAIALNGRGIVVAWSGAAAGAVIAEAQAVTEATGTRIAPYGAMLLAALRGREADARRLIQAAVGNAVAGGEGMAVQYAHWATAVLCNGLGRYDDALAAARHASDEAPELFICAWALPELIESGVRRGQIRLATRALERLAETTSIGDSDWAAGIEARSRALLSTGETAEAHFREAIERLGRTRLRPELARAHLLFGEWLRGDKRRTQARQQLRTAHELFTSMGAAGFAERARAELLATGEAVHHRSEDAREELTPQEELIARLARDGRTNPEIGAELFLSARTVEWHLRKVFVKLGVSSRRQLRAALAKAGRPVAQP